MPPAFFFKEEEDGGHLSPDTGLKLLGPPKMCSPEWKLGCGSLCYSELKDLEKSQIKNTFQTLPLPQHLKFLSSRLLGSIVQTGFGGELIHFKMCLLFHQTNQQSQLPVPLEELGDRSWALVGRRQCEGLWEWKDQRRRWGKGRDTERQLGFGKGSVHCAKRELFVSLWWCEFWPTEVFFVSNVDIQTWGRVLTLFQGMKFCPPSRVAAFYYAMPASVCVCVCACICTHVGAGCRNWGRGTQLVRKAALLSPARGGPADTLESLVPSCLKWHRAGYLISLNEKQLL